MTIIFLKIWRVVLAKHPTKSNVRIARDFARFVSCLHRKSGPVFLVKYLKACAVLLQQSTGGMKTPSAQELGAAVSRTSSGVPRIIPSLHRERIRRGDPAVIRFWLSAFNCYRVIVIPSKANLTTITKGSGIPLDLNLLPTITDFLPIFFNLLKKMTGLVDLGFGVKPLTFTSTKLSAYLTDKSISVLEGGMGANYKGSSYFAILESIWAWRTVMSQQKLQSSLSARRLVSGFVLWIKTVTPWMLPFFTSKHEVMVPLKELEIWDNISKWGYTLHASWQAGTQWQLLRKMMAHYSMGRLVGLEEPAGKLRVIAMVDILTQWALRPLHLLIFSLLEKIEQDGTFNQVRPLILLRRRMRKQKVQWIASYDLSAATDCLPIRVQVMLVSYLIGDKLADAWKAILVDRTYSFKNKEYKYGVGQPMGALSSWAMLALTHHMVVQLAARLAQPTGIPRWFTMYAVLGDDVVIADPQVAHQYVLLMGRLGVKIGLAKSLVSDKGTFEFAKRFMTLHHDLSPVSVSELLVGMVHFSSQVEIVRKNRLTVVDFLALSGYKHGVLGSLDKRFSQLPKRARTALISFLGPGSVDFNLGNWLRLVSRGRKTGRIQYQSLPLYCLEVLRVINDHLNKFALAEIQWAGKGWRQAQTSMKLESDSPELFKAIQTSVFDPLKKDQKALALDARKAAAALKKEVIEAFFSKDVAMWQVIIDKVTQLRAESFNLRVPFYDQSPTPISHSPDARALVKLYNRLSTVKTIPWYVRENLLDYHGLEVMVTELGPSSVKDLDLAYEEWYKGFLQTGSLDSISLSPNLSQSVKIKTRLLHEFKQHKLREEKAKKGS